MQSTLVTVPSSQSFDTGGRDARALMDLALHDLVANFDPKLLGQVDLKALGFLAFPTVAKGSIEEREPEVVAIIALE